MNQRKSGKQIGMAKVRRYLAAALVALSPLVLADLSYAAGRVFYDGFESGNTNLWAQDDYRNRCQVVTSAADGVAGPFAGKYIARCNWNGKKAWNDAAAYESLTLTSIKYSKKLFYRVRVRVDKNLERTSNSATKILRIYSNLDTHDDIFKGAAGLKNDSTSGPTYWGDAPGDNSSSSSSWHKVEYYLDKGTGTFKIWHDDILVRNDTNGFTGNPYPYYLTSNWSDAHDDKNYVYFDEVEVFSDSGSGASGSMSDGTISAPAATGLTPPTNLRVL